MSPNSLSVFFFFLIVVVFYASYSLNKAKSHTYCMFIRGDGTWINKWAKPKQTRIDFDNGWYYLNPGMKISKVLDNGIYKFFPTKVDGQIFTYGNPHPLDPYKFEIASLTPEVRKALNKREDIEAYSQGSKQSLQIKQKKGLLESYMPLITIVGFAIIGFVIYQLMQKVDMLGASINIAQQMLQQALAR